MEISTLKRVRRSVSLDQDARTTNLIFLFFGLVIFVCLIPSFADLQCVRGLHTPPYGPGALQRPGPPPAPRGSRRAYLGARGGLTLRPAHACGFSLPPPRGGPPRHQARQHTLRHQRPPQARRFRIRRLVLCWARARPALRPGGHALLRGS